jgi:hypothetical protein
VLSYVFGIIYNWSFIVGSMVGLAGMRAWVALKAAWDDSRHPLPGGKHRQHSHLSRLWVASVFTLFTFGYITLQAQRAHSDTVALNNDVRHCWAEAYEAARGRTIIDAQDRDLDRQRWDAESQIDEATQDWARLLLSAPPDVENDYTRRSQWIVDITNIFNTRITELRGRVSDLRKQDMRIAAEREAHPLPQITCGNGH